VTLVGIEPPRSNALGERVVRNTIGVSRSEKMLIGELPTSKMTSAERGDNG